MSGPLDAAAIARITALVLGEPAEYTREQAVDLVGTTVERSRAYWRAFGFADVGRARAFTPEDIACMRLLVGLVDAGHIDEDTSIELTRSLGQTASRLADWQAGTVARVVEASEDPVELDRLVDGVALMMPIFERLLAHAWRRHLAAAIGRSLSAVVRGGEADATGSVGFADIAGFTRLARSLADDDLAGMVHSFETGAADVVAAQGARLVKTLGDEVMFVSEDPTRALAIAVAMHDLDPPGPEPMTLRIGIATGRLVTTMGDVYGDTVNLASRLTAIARPGTTLIDEATSDGATPLPGVRIRPLPPRPLRGMGMVRASAVTRAQDRSAGDSSGNTQVR